MLLSALILASCSSSVDIMKRRYSRGYHIDSRSEAHAQREAVKAVIVNKGRHEKVAPSIIEERKEEAKLPAVNEANIEAPVVASVAVNAAAPSGQTIGKGSSMKMLVMKAKEMKKGVKSKPGEGAGGNQLIALVLCFFVGVIGIHRFYLGYYGAGIIQLLTLGACGIWTLIDFIRIITGDLKPKDGEYRKTFDDL